MKKQDLLILLIVATGVAAALWYVNDKKKREALAGKVPGATQTDKL